MDAGTFDRLARAIVTSRSRRRLLATLAALPLGAGLLPPGQDQAGAERPRDHLQRRTTKHRHKQRTAHRRNRREQHSTSGRNAERARSSAQGSLGGAPCTRDDDCASDRCLEASPTSSICACSNRLSVGCEDPSLRCLEPALRFGLCILPSRAGGEACVGDAECLSNKCLEDRCSCSTGAGGFPCKDGNQRCLNERCTTTKIGGETCQTDAECRSNQCLDIGVCSCSTGANPVGCVDQQTPCKQTVCENEICRRRDQPDGAACAANTDNPCITHVCQAGVCTHPPRPDGSACPSNGNPCTDHLCQSGQCTHPAKPESTPCGGTGFCHEGTCQCGPATKQICTDGTGEVCRLRLNQPCERDDQCCTNSMTCCRGQCRVKPGQGGCFSDDDCCRPTTVLGGACCDHVCCHTCQGCGGSDCRGVARDDC